jgi:hypothetical protein
MLRLWITAFGFAFASRCSPAPETVRIYPESETPAELLPSVERADGALLVLRTKLLETLTTEISRGGPAAAVLVCRDVAGDVARASATGEGVAVGRTSHRLRNPGNASPAWAAEIVAAGAGKKAAETPAHVADLNDRVGVLRPIGTLEMCTQCHGSADAMDPGAAERIAEAYPADRAIGFEIGDLRGWMWAEVPKAR